MAGVNADIDKMTPEEKTEEGIGKRLAGWKTTYGFKELTVSTVDGEIDIEGSMSPGKTVKKISAAAGTPPVYGSLTNGYGTSVEVAQMGTKPSGGSAASQSLTSDGWKHLIKRRNDSTGSSSFYVKGHLLNNHLGGPGDTWDNLTPLTQEGNNRSGDSMYYAFEKKVKAAVFDDKRPVTEFKVVATYGAPSRQAEIAQIDSKLKQPALAASERQTIRDHPRRDRRGAAHRDARGLQGEARQGQGSQLRSRTWSCRSTTTSRL